MSEYNETLAEIVADMRHGFNQSWYDIDREWAHGLADRIEAAYKREMSKIVSKNGADFGQLGDAAAKERIATPAEGMPPKRDAHRGAHPETAESCLGTGEMENGHTVQIGEVSGGGRAEAKPRTATAGADPEPAKSFVNAARLREALEQIRDMIMGGGFDGRSPAYIVNICDAALSAPPRNCDRFANLHDAWVAWQSDCAYNIGTETMRFLVWLYSTAEKGETDGSK